jgi:hypothetical protein
LTIHKIYSLTSIGRPVDWNVPTNRSMLILLVPSALAGAAVAFWQDVATSQTLMFALATALAAFGGWAMGRELDPDDQPAAFIALAVSVLVILFIGPAAGNHHLLVLFTCLGLVRQVNRTTGLEARLSDSVILLALTLWVIYGTANPLFGLVAAASFALDATLEKPLRRQLIFALLSFGATVVYMVDHDIGRGVYEIPQTLPQWWAAVAAVVFALNMLLMREVTSVADVSRRKLDPARVRGGMAVAAVAVAQGLPEVTEVALLAAVIAGVCLAWAFRRSFRTPA